MQIDGNHYTADDGKVFADLDNHALGTNLYLGAGTVFEENYKEIPLSEVVEVENQGESEGTE